MYINNALLLSSLSCVVGPVHGCLSCFPLKNQPSPFFPMAGKLKPDNKTHQSNECLHTHRSAYKGIPQVTSRKSISENICLLLCAFCYLCVYASIYICQCNMGKMDGVDINAGSAPQCSEEDINSLHLNHSAPSHVDIGMHIQSQMYT